MINIQPRLLHSGVEVISQYICNWSGARKAAGIMCILLLHVCCYLVALF
ncbi:hypothetical protein CORMATOL_00855 [Corynebacterium matruchotii ATCC 33806]|uniref:Uncharacterized protein n=1 Tax=Corynebacterium matruchotii ATCC 33806 TaxID=566549 RepID=C0E1K4_9CORY|nr:hypothetical protein CORMATOL_00855 [Corynebacterium matruchotii ATCC 33806]